MESRKKQEIEYFDKAAKQWQQKYKNNTDVEGYDINMFSSYRFCQDLIKKYVKPDMKLLDYGCGHGMHSILPAQLDAEVYGIDLSEESLKIARRRTKEEKLENKIKFSKMDCENLEFDDNYFDIIWDGGTFSSLNLEKVYKELSRVLKPTGKLIGIETFGHNPFANLKRRLNKKRGGRTTWAAEHIIKAKDLKQAHKYFNEIKVYYFHFLSMFAFPFRNTMPGKFLFKFLDHIDNLFLKIPWLKKYAFKIVFIFSSPKK